LRRLGQRRREIDIIGFGRPALHALNFDFVSHGFIFSYHYNSIYTIIKENVKKTPQPAAPRTSAKHLSIGTLLLPEADLLHLAKDLKFTKRAPRKIDGVHWLASVCAECLQGSPSCNDLAAQIQTLAGSAPSRQAVSLRLNQAFENILQRLLEMVLREKIAGDGSSATQLKHRFGNYCRVLVQDSTIIQLPGHLFEDFSGYLDPQTGQPIDLLALLKNQGSLDLEVLLNNEAHTRVRLVTAPVDAETANRRRQRAKIATHGHHPSPAVLAFMDWTIFITTIPATSASFKEILAIYGLRWRIEIIFKGWKSHMKFPLLHRVSKQQLAILLKARLLLITACTNLAFGPLERTLRQNYSRRLSLLKFLGFLSKNPVRLINVLYSLTLSEQENQALYHTLLRYCCYDKRKRPNYSETWDALSGFA